MRGAIDFDHVGFTYANGAEILDDFDAHIAAGETVAIVGRTGSGKSTVARLLTRFYDVTDGAITIDGHDVRDLTLSSLRANVGVVLDEPFLFSVSIRDNIAYGMPDATDERGRGGGARGATPTSSSIGSPRATTPWSASAATPCRVASASASPSRAPCWSIRRS